VTDHEVCPEHDGRRPRNLADIGFDLFDVLEHLARVGVGLLDASVEFGEGRDRTGLIKLENRKR